MIKYFKFQQIKHLLDLTTKDNIILCEQYIKYPTDKSWRFQGWYTPYNFLHDNNVCDCYVKKCKSKSADSLDLWVHQTYIELTGAQIKYRISALNKDCYNQLLSI